MFISRGYGALYTIASHTHLCHELPMLHAISSGTLTVVDIDIYAVAFHIATLPSQFPLATILCSKVSLDNKRSNVSSTLCLQRGHLAEFCNHVHTQSLWKAPCAQGKTPTTSFITRGSRQMEQ